MYLKVLIFFLVGQASVYAASPSAVPARHGLVTSTSALASQAGVDILRQGGNAVDAAVATAFALAVTYPAAGNIGGGGFALVRLPDGRVFSLDHRETAPASASRDMYLDTEGEIIKGLSLKTHKASGTPGSVDGLLELHGKFGVFDRKVVMQSAIDLAQGGFPLSWQMAESFNRMLRLAPDFPATRKKFSNAGEPFQAGDIWKQPDLARTMQAISEQGRQGFYNGWVAAAIAAEMRSGDGNITASDLQQYHSVWRSPIKGEYRGYQVWSMGPPSSGGVLLVQMLNMLEAYDVKSMGWGSAEQVHLMVEAERRSYADRARHLGDPDFWDVPVALLTSKQYARQRMSNFDASQATPSHLVGAGEGNHESEQTTHFSVIDKDGLMVSLTTTLNSGYGSRLVIPGTGILMNNEMDDFSIKPNTPNQFGLLGMEANKISPRKRMLSSMTPTLVTHQGEPFLITGSPGGSTIITTVLQVIVNLVDHGMSIADAVALPRFHHQWLPDVIYYGRYGLSPDTITKLRSKGHELEQRSVLGDANSIHIVDGVRYGFKDPRHEGQAVGY